MDKQNSKTLFDRTFASSRDNHKQILDMMMNVLAESGIIPGQDTKSLYLSVDEALTNAMEHGNHWNPDKNVHITIEMGPSDILIMIEDEGNGFDPDPFVHNRQPDSTSKRGRGIRLISQLCTPRWNAKGNRIELRVNTTR